MPRLRKAVLVLEMSLDSDHASEGKFIVSYLDVLGIPYEYRRVRSRERLLKELTKPEARYVHMSSHGYAVESEAGFVMPNHDEFGINDLIALSRQLQGRVILASGCYTGRVSVARAMLKTGCSFYIAPRRLVPWSDAAVFEALFYRYHLNLGFDIPRAFDLARENAKALGDWQLYSQPS